MRGLEARRGRRREDRLAVSISNRLRLRVKHTLNARPAISPVGSRIGLCACLLVYFTQMKKYLFYFLLYLFILLFDSKKEKIRVLLIYIIDIFYYYYLLLLCVYLSPLRVSTESRQVPIFAQDGSAVAVLCCKTLGILNILLLSRDGDPTYCISTRSVGRPWRAGRLLSSPALAEIKTALYDFHVANKGKMVPFAGYQLPVLYEGEDGGVLKGTCTHARLVGRLLLM